MDWTAFAAVASVLGTIGLGILTFLRGTKADEALNTATNVQSTFTAQRELVDNLQEEVNRHRDRLFQCEDDCRSCRSNLAGSRMIISAQEVEIENLKGIVAEHEQTIAKHERALAAVSRRQDMTPNRENDEERRQ